jgi:UrcA family protein
MGPIGRTVARLLVSALILTGVGPVANVTLAGEVTQSNSITLQLTEHALDTAQGVAVTYARIRSAARSVCGYADHAFRQELDDWNDCVAGTIRDTVVQIGNPKLTDFYLSRSGAPLSHRNEGFGVGLRVP